MHFWLVAWSVEYSVCRPQYNYSNHFRGIIYISCQTYTHFDISELLLAYMNTFIWIIKILKIRTLISHVFKTYVIIAGKTFFLPHNVYLYGEKYLQIVCITGTSLFFFIIFIIQSRFWKIHLRSCAKGIPNEHRWEKKVINEREWPYKAKHAARWMIT